MSQNLKVERFDGPDSRPGTAKGARRVAFVAGVLGAVAAVSMSLWAHVPTTDVTWVRDIAPIVEQRCLGCHGTGGASSVPLGAYEGAKAAAARIKREVLDRRMPPWPAAPGFGAFVNDRSLSLVETQLLVAWVDGGAPKGQDSSDSLPRPGAVPGGEETPTAPPGERLFLTLPEAAPAGGSTQTFELATGLVRDTWIGAWEFLPGNRAAIEQAEIAIAGGSVIGMWVPPETRTQLPAGVAQLLPAASRISLRISYRKTSGPITRTSAVALYLTPRPRQPLLHLPLPCGSTRLPRGIRALAIRPAASRSGLPVEVLARRPDGSVDALCVIRDYQLRYEVTYRFRQPVLLPAGSEVALAATEDGCRADLEYVRQ